MWPFGTSTPGLATLSASLVVETSMLVTTWPNPTDEGAGSPANFLFFASSTVKPAAPASWRISRYFATRAAGVIETSQGVLCTPGPRPRKSICEALYACSISQSSAATVRCSRSPFAPGPTSWSSKRPLSRLVRATEIGAATGSWGEPSRITIACSESEMTCKRMTIRCRRAPNISSRACLWRLERLRSAERRLAGRGRLKFASSAAGDPCGSARGKT